MAERNSEKGLAERELGGKRKRLPRLTVKQDEEVVTNAPAPGLLVGFYHLYCTYVTFYIILLKDISYGLFN